MSEGTCDLPGCEKAARTPGSALCKMHYHRQYRHGSTSAHASGITASSGRHYRSQHLPTHPLAGGSGRVYVHRVVLYAAIGPGPHSCHWCGLTVDWCSSDAPLHVDHLNAVGDDNRLENLVASCRRCNSLRAQQARHRALVVVGFWSQNDTVGRQGTGRKPLVA